MAVAVLVGYATANGSTQGVAERIGDRLRQHGVAVDVRPVDDVLDLGRYDGFVLGSAIHGGTWLPAAAQFIDRQAAVLGERPVWLFSVSTVGDQESMFGPRVAKRLSALRKEAPEIRRFRSAVGVREHRNFAGVIAPSHWTASGRAFFRVMGGRYGDHRNWDAIEAWADHIAGQLLSAADGPEISPLGG